MILFWVLIYAIAFGTVTSLAAKSRQKDPASWFLIGFVFGVFGLIAVLVIGESDQDDEEPRTNRPTGFQRKENRVLDTSDMTKKCTMCAEEIKFDAKMCRHCGHTFTQEELDASLKIAEKRFQEAETQRKSDERLREIRDRRGW